MMQTERNGHLVRPPELASSVNLFVHPFAGVAAASALGFGLASHAFGYWMGAYSAMAEVSQRMFSPFHDDFNGDVGSFKAKRSAAKKAESAAQMLIEEARSTAQAASLAGRRRGGRP